MSETVVTEEVSAAGENRDCAKKEEKDSIRLMRAGLSDAKELHEMQKVCFWADFSSDRISELWIRPGGDPSGRGRISGKHFLGTGNHSPGAEASPSL